MIVKITSYTRIRSAAKATVRYIMHRPNREGERVTRPLFNPDGPMHKYHAYSAIDEAPKGSVFFRTAFSPDPSKEDTNKDLDLELMTQVAMRYMKEKLREEFHFKGDIQFFAAEHSDQSSVRHVNAVIIMPGKLTKEQFRAFPKLLKQAAAAEVNLQRDELDPEPAQDLEWQSHVQQLPAAADAFTSEGRRGEYSPRASALKPIKPSCPDCGVTTTLWKIDVNQYICMGCGSSFEGVGYSGGIQQEGVQLSL